MLAIYRSLMVILVLMMAGCAGLPLREPLKVTVARLEALPSDGLEARFAVTLRVQNPNDTALAFDGVSLNLELAGKDFGSGVSDQYGSVPRYGETLITVPVTVPLTAILRQVFDLASGRRDRSIRYRLHGRLGGLRAGKYGVGGTTFDSEGELVLPDVEDRVAP
jgi:LEA14-like dessication related protein